MVEQSTDQKGESCILDYDDIIIKTAVKNDKTSTTSRIYLPTAWQGRHVLCVLLKDKGISIPQSVKIINSLNPITSSSNSDEKKAAVKHTSKKK